MSSLYSVRFTRAAGKDLQAQDAPVRARILRNIAALADDPRPPGVKRLAAVDNLWRVRVGDYRIVYEIRDAELIVRVIRVARRGKYYSRGFPVCDRVAAQRDALFLGLVTLCYLLSVVAG